MSCPSFRLLIAYFQRGLSHLGGGDKPAAENDISTAIQLAPASARSSLYHLKRGDIRLSGGRDSEAIADYELARQNDPNNSDAWFALGRAYDKLATQESDA